MKTEMLINVAQSEECRIAIVEDGVLEELYIERSSQDNYVGNIYKGKIVNLEPSIQAAFVDFGVGRNGFLHISDVEPQYFRQAGFDPSRPIEPDGTQKPLDEEDAKPKRRRSRRSSKKTTRDDEHGGDDDSAAIDADVVADETASDGFGVEMADEVSDDVSIDEAVEAVEVAPESAAPVAEEPPAPPEPKAKPAAAKAPAPKVKPPTPPQPSGGGGFGAGILDELLPPAEPEEEEEEEEFAEDASELEDADIDSVLDEADEDDVDDDDVDDDSSDGGGGGGAAVATRRRTPRKVRPGVRPRVKPPIEEIFRKGDEVVVQVIKEGIGTKGPTLSTYISIPGRYLVLMPALGRIGVSRKIEDDDARKRLRGILRELDPPKGLGFIVRTAGTDRTKRDLSRDLAYLLRLWKMIVRRIKKQDGPGDLYEESDIVIRTIRDIFSSEIDVIYIDEPEAYERAREFLQVTMPRYVNRLKLYEGKEPLYAKHKLDEEIQRINERQVPLKRGGSLVIDQTEALVAIDVNSGTFRTSGGAEESAYQLNLIAAKEIARQLRLRDLGGVIVNDFIDMRKDKHRRHVEKTLKDSVKRDRARTKILRTSPFGLIEMTRQRIRPSLKRSVYRECPSCHGAGLVKSAESMAIEVLRKLPEVAYQDRVATISVTVEEQVSVYLNNRKRREIAQLEDEAGVEIMISGREAASPELLRIVCSDSMGNELRLGSI
ncbi:MAG: Rne/Rng family ribonuclease [Planctomycetota bacterium]